MADEFTPQQDYVLNTINNRDVHFVRFWLSDVLGNLKSFALVPNELERSFKIGVTMDGNPLAGFESSTEQDIIVWPDAASFQILPWRPDEKRVGRMFCNAKTPDGDPFASDTRYILQKVLEHASELGFLVNIKPEIEFYYFADDQYPCPLDEGSSFDLTSLDSASDLRRDTILTLEALGIPVEKSHHEKGPSQNEIDLRTQDALSMADSILTYKAAVKEIANKHGVFASFMPKPTTELPGSGMNVQIHLVDKKANNVFYSKTAKKDANLSKTAKCFMAGVLKHAKEFCLLTNQYQNSYKRFCSPEYLATNIAWSKNSKKTILRVPGHRPKEKEYTRVILKMPDVACNPYLAFAGIIAAGLDGIEQNLKLEAATEDTETEGKTFEKLPETLGEAVYYFESSELMNSVLGDVVFRYITDVKRREWRRAISVVDDYELEQYLAVL